MYTGILSPGLETQTSQGARSGVGEKVNLMPQDGIREAEEQKKKLPKLTNKKCLQEAKWCEVFSGEAIKQKQF